MNSEDIISEAREWIGTPFGHQGRIKGYKVDCIGLVYGVARVLNLTDVELPAYAPEPFGDSLLNGLKEHLVMVPKSEYTTADILLFKFAKLPQHVAIYTGDTLIHAYSNVGKCVEHQFDARWKRMHYGTFRFKELM